MTLLKAALGGLVGALLVGATWVAAEFTILFLKANQLMANAPDGAGGLGAVSLTSHVPEATVIGFLIGAWWEWRRTSRPAR